MIGVTFGRLSFGLPFSKGKVVVLRILSRSDVEAALPMPDAIEAMRQAFASLARRTVDVPQRTVLPMNDRDLTLTMPWASATHESAGAKLLTVKPTNPQRGLPAIHGAVVMFDSATGRPSAILEGTSLTAIRTGAASGLATDLLALPDADSVAIIGAGAQARTQLKAVCCVRPIRSAKIFSRTKEKAEEFASEIESWHGGPEAVMVADSAAQAVRDVTVVCTATQATSPLFEDVDLSPGVHINAIGSYTPAMREIPEATVEVSRVVVDQREAALEEAGELISALEKGVITVDDMVELGQIVVGVPVGREHVEQKTLFKSVGLAVQDMFAAESAIAGAVERGLGTTVPF